MSRARAPRLVTETRRTSASSSDDTTTSSLRVQRTVAPEKFSMVLVEFRLVGIRFDGRGLITGGPDILRLLVAKKDVRAPAIASRHLPASA